MTTASDIQPIVDTPLANHPLGGRRGRIAAGFVFGLIAVFALATGALLALEAQYEGRVLQGISVGTVDVSGLNAQEAAARITQTYGALANGELVLTAGGTTESVAYAEVGRRVDSAALVEQAMAIGRSGNPIERLISDVRTAFRGMVVEPRVTYDPVALDAAISSFAAGFDRAPVDASIARSGDGFTVQGAEIGQTADSTSTLAAAAAALGRLDAPVRLEAIVPLTSVEPEVTTADATFARIVADRIAQDIVLVDGSETWTIQRATVLNWIGFTKTPEGSLAPIIGTPGLRTVLTEMAPGMEIKPVNATFLFGKEGAAVGVEAGVDGRQLDVEATTPVVAAALSERAGGTDPGELAPAFTLTKPSLSTEDAQKTAPLMKRLSTWTTAFPISERNGFGANIWIPSRDIDGYVVLPGATFDYWDALGPVTRERGYRDGGAIINGKTEPQGALAGGICSSSTTLFNAALRAGLEMGARRNHYYYIDRYPLGLDATVFKSSSGSVQSMTFTNDTSYPILIRGLEIKDGSKGYTRFDLYGVPDGRTVSLSAPIVKDIRKATDTTVYTSRLAAGRTNRIEYPVDGKKVWVTRTVRDASGKIIHQETYYSSYARITGVLEVGTSGTEPPPGPDPTPTPAPASPAPPP